MKVTSNWLKFFILFPSCFLVSFSGIFLFFLLVFCLSNFTFKLVDSRARLFIWFTKNLSKLLLGVFMVWNLTDTIMIWNFCHFLRHLGPHTWRIFYFASFLAWCWRHSLTLHFRLALSHSFCLFHLINLVLECHSLLFILRYSFLQVLDLIFKPYYIFFSISLLKIQLSL